MSFPRFFLGGLLLLSVIRPGLATPRDAEGLTPLHRAAGRGETAEVQRLLDEGFDPLALDSRMGVSVLHKAVYSGRAETVEFLLKRGALVNLQSPSNGNTPIHDALYFKRGDDLSVVRVLLANGANLSLRNRAGLTPLESAHLLRDHQAESLLQESETRRQSAASRQLMRAVQTSDLGQVQKLFKVGPLPLEETDSQGFTPLTWAAREGFVPIVRLLLEHGADPNHLDQWMGATAGHKAAFWGRTEVMGLLINHHLDLDARGGYNGYTALMDAVTRNHLEVARLLVEAGARLDVAGHDGLTAVDIAQRNQNSAILELLQSRLSR